MRGIGLARFVARSLLFSRLRYSALIMVVLITLFALGPLAPLTAEEGRQIKRQIEWIIQENMALGIFLNNFVVALIACVPFAGAPLMAYIAFNTGRFVGWNFLEFGISPHLAVPATLLTVLLSGFGLLEFMGYAIMVCESLVLTRKISWRIAKKRFDGVKADLKELLIMTIIAGLLLAAAAVIEAHLISILGGVVQSSSARSDDDGAGGRGDVIAPLSNRLDMNRTQLASGNPVAREINGEGVGGSGPQGDGHQPRIQLNCCRGAL